VRRAKGRGATIVEGSTDPAVDAEILAAHPARFVRGQRAGRGSLAAAPGLATGAIRPPSWPLDKVHGSWLRVKIPQQSIRDSLDHSAVNSHSFRFFRAFRANGRLATVWILHCWLPDSIFGRRQRPHPQSTASMDCSSRREPAQTPSVAL